MFKFLKKIFGSSDAAQPAAPQAPEAGAAHESEAIEAEARAAAQLGPESVAADATRTTEPARVDPADAPVQHPAVEVAPELAAADSAPSETAAEVPRALPDDAAAQSAESDVTAPARAELLAPAPAPVTPPPAARVPLSPSLSEKPATPAPAWRGGPSLIGSALVTPIEIPVPSIQARERWLDRLKSGLRKTGSNISGVFTGAQITEELYEDLESALLLADTGVPATSFLLDDVRRRVKAGGATHPIAVKNALVESLTQLLKPLEKELVIGEFTPTVIMVAGVNGAGKTTSIGKLTRHLANAGAEVLLAAADTFRAAAREQLGIWADRNQVEIVSQQGADPAAVSYDAVAAGKARGKDVVLVDTAGRLPTQLHLMEELKKIRRVVQKADPTAPHEVLLVIDGNTGQNALAQVKAFDAALSLTGLIVTKLDGTAKGGMLAAIAQWGAERAKQSGTKPVPVYFIGVGEKLEDLETFNAREFAQALLT